MSRISVRGIAVASATAVTTVGAVVGVASGSEPTAAATQPVADVTALNDIAGSQAADAELASLTQQVQAQQAAADAAAKKAAEAAARQKAAAEAAKKKAEAEAKALEAKLLAEASQLGNFSVAAVQQLAEQIIGNGSQYQCFSWIVTRESGWNYRATNASSGAYGLVQALPGSKMASAGADWRTNPATQIKWGLSYMNSRYGSPCGAQQFWAANGWY